jgi:tRNA U38,U39,U40 pseudouridine synthase TruA
MIDVGLGKRHAGDIRPIMRGRDRSSIPTLAPAHGLTLWEVGYPSDGGGTRAGARVRIR